MGVPEDKWVAMLRGEGARDPSVKISFLSKVFIVGSLRGSVQGGKNVP
jgi:hypothetical protein